MLFKMFVMKIQISKIAKRIFYRAREHCYASMELNGEKYQCNNEIVYNIQLKYKVDKILVVISQRFENLLPIILFMLGFLIRSLKSKKSDFRLLCLDCVELSIKLFCSSSDLFDRKLILLQFAYLESKFKITGVISYSLALIIELCLMSVDFLSLLLIGFLQL